MEKEAGAMEKARLEHEEEVRALKERVAVLKSAHAKADKAVKDYLSLHGEIHVLGRKSAGSLPMETLYRWNTIDEEEAAFAFVFTRPDKEDSFTETVRAAGALVAATKQHIGGQPFTRLRNTCRDTTRGSENSGRYIRTAIVVVVVVCRRSHHDSIGGTRCCCRVTSSRIPSRSCGTTCSAWRRSLG